MRAALTAILLTINVCTYAQVQNGWNYMGMKAISEPIIQYYGLMDQRELETIPETSLRKLTTALDKFQILEGLSSIDTDKNPELFDAVAAAEEYFYLNDQERITKDAKALDDEQGGGFARYQFAYLQKIQSNAIKLPLFSRFHSAVFKRDSVESIFHNLTELMGEQLKSNFQGPEFVDVFGDEARRNKLLNILKRVGSLDSYAKRYKRLMWSLRNRNSIYSDFVSEAKVAEIE